MHHNHETKILACYCPDDASTTTVDNVISEVSDELGISKDTVNSWVNLVVVVVVPHTSL
jgi:hypothetical protein